MSQHDTLTPAQTQVEEAANRLQALISEALGTRHAAMNDLAVLMMHARSAALATPPAQAQQPPYAWAVSGLATPFYGPHAEFDARQEAKRCGGTAEAFPLFREAQAQQVAGEVVAWVDVHDRTNLYYRKPPQGDVRPLVYGDIPPAPASQPAVQGVPEGWKLVPVEPTWDMKTTAMVLADREWCYHVGRDDAKKLWSAMLAASPTPPAQQGEPT